MRILLFGGNGQVGREVQTLAGAAHALSAPGRDRVDLADPQAVADAILGEPWDVVVNAAAYTAVDRAEQDEANAFAVNAAAPGHMARACARAGVPLIHLSTDYVFDGSKAGAYTEDDPVRPLGVYGASKAAGESAIREALPNHVILRTAWVFSRHGHNFVRTMLRLAGERPELRVVDDQVGNPTAAADIAAAVLAIAARAGAGADVRGTYHFSGAGHTTWFGFAKAIFELRREIAGIEPPAVHPIPTSAYPTPARRPANSELDCTLIRTRLGILQPDWRPALATVVRALL